ncbi:hypothetical protein [Corynebacterium pseudotuberculosis]|uniref:hypothetical protein n=1 Tax=Corynebacterium pseudotuberculosis TaxID=1719 RepID=UPI00070F0BBB|nr:hypothetical protein [Corynebacterium pseudotuberculosis]ALM78297.1 Hypothetical protein Cp1002B_1771 [Corynebacterium pseudotuberculosis]
MILGFVPKKHENPLHILSQKGLMGRSFVVLMVSLLLVSCSTSARRAEQSKNALVNSVLEEARIRNLNRHVASNFVPEPQVIGVPYDSGVAASRLFFDASDTVVISDSMMVSQLRASSISGVAHAPMLTMTEQSREEVIAEITRLGARYVLAVGDVALSSVDGSRRVIKDDGSFEALGRLTSLRFTPREISEKEALEKVAMLDPADIALLVIEGASEPPPTSDPKKTMAFPLQSKRDAEAAPIVIASAESGIAAVATARSYGATIRMMPVADPRYSEKTMSMVAGLSDEALIALGSQFGTSEKLAETIRFGEKTRAWPKSGSGIVFSHQPTIAAWNSGKKSGNNGDAQAFYLPETEGSFSSAHINSAKEWATRLEEQGKRGFLVMDPAVTDSVAKLAGLQDILMFPGMGVALSAERHDGSVMDAVAWLDRFVRERGLPQKALVVFSQSPTALPELQYPTLVPVAGTWLRCASQERLEEAVQGFDRLPDGWLGAVLNGPECEEDHVFPELNSLFNSPRLGLIIL